MHLNQNNNKCNHTFDGGYCLKCGKKSLCELCKENVWETRCDICQSGRICDECYIRCEKCNQKTCKVCDGCNCSDEESQYSNETCEIHAFENGICLNCNYECKHEHVTGKDHSNKSIAICDNCYQEIDI